MKYFETGPLVNEVMLFEVCFFFFVAILFNSAILAKEHKRNILKLF